MNVVSDSTADRRVVRALVVDPSSTTRVRFSELEEPHPKPDQVVIDVHHASLNHGDLVRARVASSGSVLGMDASGIVVCAASGSGPAVGTRVAAFGLGAWAERIAVDIDCVCEVPASIGLAVAAALPTAGVTALRAVRAAGPVLGKRVLITGAAGGVGRYAVQFAALGGAHVVASVGSAARVEGLAALGAHEVVVGLEGVEGIRQPVDAIVDNVGGAQLAPLFRVLAPGGHLVSVGWASGEPAMLPAFGTFAFGAARTLTDASGIMFGDKLVADDLSVVLGNVRAGRLSPEIGWRGSWERFGDAMRAQAARQVAGKAVLDLR